MSDLIDGVFYSSLIQRNVRYRVLVPDAVSQGNEPVPVLYLLHGLFGSCENWTDLTGLRRYVDGSDLLIVMPDGGDNWYTDSGEAHESYLIQDLMPEMESRFRASSERGKRAIAGNSMGGYGAIKLALKYPEKFAFAASFSGAFHVTRLVADSGELAPSIRRVFGDEGSRIRRENDIFEIAARSHGIAGTLPRFYLDCGTEDEFVAANREFASTLTAAGIEHEFLEVTGGHDWPYWDERIGYLIPLLKAKLSDKLNNWLDQL